MKDIFNKSFFCCMILLFTVSNIYATSPDLKELLTISDARVISYDELTKTVVIEYKVEAKENFRGILKASSPNSVSDVQLQTMSQELYLSKSAEEYRTLSFIISDNDISYFSLNISVPSASEAYKQEYYRYFKIVKSGGDVSISDPRKETELKPKEAGKDITILRGTDPLNPESLNYTVNISGRIMVNILEKGLYGNGVALWFRNSANPGTWYHPIINDQINVTYDLLDEHGNFNFNFSFTGNLSGYNQALVLINTANDAAYLPAPSDGYESWGPHGYTYYFNESQGVISYINGSNSNITVNQNGVINKEDGSILRYLQLAREFIIQRYGGSLPFSIQQVKTFNSELVGEVAGRFTVDWSFLNGWYNYITIDPDFAEISTITHEYGHYINLRMWNNNMAEWASADDDLIEGWAIFYCFAARNYINKVYGDDIYIVQSNDDNTEYAPFRPGLRYGNIRYAQHGEPMKAACACNIWNLYDSYSGGNFELTAYNGDNDDVSGYGTLVFECLRNAGIFATPSTIHFAFYNAVPVELRQSVVDINFFMYDNLTSIPPHKMKSAQISNIGLTNISASQIRLNWSPQSYPGGYTEVNAPTEYRVYKNISGNWQVFATTQFGTNYIDIPMNGAEGLYKFSATNSSGDSYSAIEKQIFNITLSPASYIEPGSGGYYKVNGNNIGTTWSGVFLQGTSPLILEAIPPTNYIFLKWSDGNTANPRQISSGSINVYAIYKGLGLSDNPNAYSSNSQRKFIKSIEGWLHSVYESQGKIWYEYSTDNGVTWLLGNEKQSLGSGKQPSIDYSFIEDELYSYYQIFIVYQWSLGEQQIIRLAYFDRNGNEYIYRDSKDVATVAGNYETTNTTPVIAANNGLFSVVWKNGAGNLYARSGYADVFQSNLIVWSPYQSNALTGTTSNSINPTIYSSKTSSGTGVIKLAWEELGVNNTSAIYYATLSNNQISGGVTTISAGSGYTRNYQPSIIELNNEARLVWIGYRQMISDDEEGVSKINLVNDEYRVVFKASDYYYFWGFGNNVNSPNINKFFNNTGYVYAWSENSGGSYINKFGDQTLSIVKTIPGVAGKDIQVSNGTSKSNMYANVFSTQTSPYNFKLSQNFASIPKINNLAISKGREGIVYKAEGQFYFMLVDIQVDGQLVDFIQIPDTVNVDNKEVINSYLTTEPFDLADNSNFSYGVQYGITDSLSTANIMDENNFINFKVELIDEVTGDIIGTHDDITFTRVNLTQYNNINYQVNTSGIGNKTVRLKLRIEDNLSPNYSMSQKMADENLLSKSTVKEINYQNSAAIKSYDLSQNYPNPFNPTTVINYQIPKDGLVTIKVYDILGKEVTTLVNENKSIGRYSVNFDGSNLASGVYIYRITSGDFVATKKMMMIK